MKRKISKVSVLILTLCLAVAGGIVGFLSGIYIPRDFVLDDFLNTYSPYAFYIATGLSICVLIISLAFPFRYYCKSKSMYKNGDKEDDELISAIDRILGYGSIILSVLSILSLIPFAIWFHNFAVSLKTDALFESSNISTLWVTYLIIFAVILFNFVLYRAVVQLVKKTNPEKKGDVLSLKFSKDWESTLGEAEKMIVYKVSRKAYQFISKLSYILFFVALIGDLLFGFGIVPAIFTGAIAIASVLSVNIYLYSFSKRVKSGEDIL
ncbi:MAG: DUF3169 family protein [Ruminococcus sp.]